MVWLAQPSIPAAQAQAHAARIEEQKPALRSLKPRRTSSGRPGQTTRAPPQPPSLPAHRASIHATPLVFENSPSRPTAKPPAK